MKKKSDLESCPTETAQKLTMIDVGQGVGRFCLDDDFPFDEQVQSVAPNHLVEEVDWNENLPLHLEAILSKNTHQGLDIDLLEEAVP